MNYLYSTIGQIRLFVFSAFTALGVAHAQTSTLISDDFPTSGVLNGTTPATTVAGASWVALTGTGAATSNGTALTLPAQNQTDVVDLATFIPTHPGIYTMSMNVGISSGTSVNLQTGIGFSVNPVTADSFGFATSNPGLNPNGGTNGGSPWVSLSQSGSLRFNSYNSTYIYASGATAYPSGTTYNLALSLDTSKPLWVMNGYLNSTQLDLNGSLPGVSYKYATNPTNIRYAGFSTVTLAGSSSTVSNYRLTYTSPADFPAAEVAPNAHPYNTIWTEGEAYSSQSGGSVVTASSDYAGKEWRVTNGSSSSSATYTINVPTAGTYLLSLAGSPIGVATSSPLSYSIDGGTAVALTATSTSATSWGTSGFTWNNTVLITFSTAGSHSITFALTGPRTSDGTYNYAIDAFGLIEQPTSNLFYNDANYATAQWTATASASTASSSYPANSAMAGDPAMGWEPTTAAAGQSLTITFPSARTIEAVHLVKGANAPSGSSMPTSYTIDFLEGGVWVHRISETSNTVGDVSYELPGFVTATAMRMTVNATQSGNNAFVNQLEAYGPFGPEILAPMGGSLVGNGTYNVIGLTQPNALVNLSVNGAVGPAVTADSAGYFSSSVTLSAGANTIGAQATLGSVTSSRTYSSFSYSASASPSLSLFDRKGHHVIFNEGANNLVVYAVDQAASVSYTVSDENANTISTGSLNLSQGAALLPLPSSAAGWYSITINGGPALTQSTSVSPSKFVLPSISPVSSDIAVTSVNKLPYTATADQPNFIPVVSDYAGMAGLGWMRDRISWANANTNTGSYDWTADDAAVNGLIARGQKVMPVVYNFPAYLNSRNNSATLPDDLRSTYSWGQTLANHYKGRVSAYEFQNECDTTNYYNLPYQTVNELMAHQRAFYLGVKSMDSNALVMPNPPAYPAAVKGDVANELQNLRGEAMDAFTFHWYPTFGTSQNEITMIQTPGTGFNMPENMAAVTNMLGDRAAWLSECGYSGVISGSDMPLSEERIQADFYAKMAPLALSNGINKPFAFIMPRYFELSNEFGMLRPTGFSPRVAMNSTATTSQMLRSAQYYGSLNTGNSNLTGLVFQNGDGSYLLELWALNSSGVGAYSLPGGVTDTGVVDYLGRVTDTGSTTSVNVQTTAKFITLSGASVTAVTTPSGNPYPNPSLSGVAPSPIVMAWHINLPCKTADFEDYYNSVAGATNNCSLEVVNLSSTSFSGNIAVTPSNSRWTIPSGTSLPVSLAPQDRVLIPVTLIAPSIVDTLRIEARVDDNSGQTSSAAELVQTIGGSGTPSAFQPDGSHNITIDCTAPVQNYFGYDGHLHWNAGTDGTVNYLGALPSAGLSFTGTQMFKAPLLNYLVNFDLRGTWYYVWVKAKAGTGTSNYINVSVVGNPASVNLANNITGFNSGGWTWSRTVVGTTTAAQLGISSTGVYTLNVWANDDGMQISQIVLTSNVNYVPSN